MAAPVPADAVSSPTGAASGVECAAMVGMEGTADEGATSCERIIEKDHVLENIIYTQVGFPDGNVTKYLH